MKSDFIATNKMIEAKEKAIHKIEQNIQSFKENYEINLLTQNFVERLNEKKTELLNDINNLANRLGEY